MREPSGDHVGDVSICGMFVSRLMIAPEFDARGRDYNFFDELDAKLARMDGHGEEG